MDNTPQDFISREYAAPQEQAFQASNVFSPNGVGLQGVPGNEQYQIGQDYNGLAPMAQPSSGVGIGGLDASDLYGIANPFPDQQPAYDTRGFDSQAGIVTGALPASLSGDRMYVSPYGLESVGFHQYPGTNPEIAGE